jgi:hypothetical protein
MWVIESAIGRLRTDQRTKDYVARRIAEGHSKLDAIRALKSYLAREVFTLITQRRKEINATRMPLDKQKGVQGSQFTSIAFTGLLLKNEIKISMDGKGAWRDNIFVERLWRTIKYEEVYLRAYASVAEARASIGRYIDTFYNARRPHSSLDRRTPDEAYFTALQPIPAAA